MMSLEYVISASYGNDSMALMQWAFERGLKNVTVAYCDTGWSAPGWNARVLEGEAHAKRLGFNVVRLQSMGMEALVRMKKGFPGNGQQFCTAWLKGLPFLTWIDEADPDRTAIIMIGKRRAESEARKDTPEFIEASEYHGDRKVWHSLYLHTEKERNALLARMGVPVLPHRSKECSPCVNANRNDLRNLAEERIECVESLEGEVGQPMFREAKRGAKGIRQVVAWAKYSPGQYNPAMDDIFEDEGCGSPFGCGL
jgi:tRNA(Ile)-lysidine synthase TilS/MesJ